MSSWHSVRSHHAPRDEPDAPNSTDGRWLPGTLLVTQSVTAPYSFAVRQDTESQPRYLAAAASAGIKPGAATNFSSSFASSKFQMRTSPLYEPAATFLLPG